MRAKNNLGTVSQLGNQHTVYHSDYTPELLEAFDNQHHNPSAIRQLNSHPSFNENVFSSPEVSFLQHHFPFKFFTVEVSVWRRRGCFWNDIIPARTAPWAFSELLEV